MSHTYSIKSIVDNPSQIEEIRTELQNSEISYYLPIIDSFLEDALIGGEFDADFLSELDMMLNKLLSDPYFQAESYELEGLAYSDRPGKRPLDRLIHKRRPTVGPLYLSLLAFQRCLEGINAYNANSCSNNVLIELYGEASEAIALSKGSYSLFCVIEDYKELLRNYNNRKPETSSQKGLLGTIKKREAQQTRHDAEILKKENTISQLLPLVEEAWLIDASLPIGCLADAIQTEIFERISSYKEEYMHVGRDKLLMAFKGLAKSMGNTETLRRGKRAKKEFKHNLLSNCIDNDSASRKIMKSFGNKVLLELGQPR